MTLTPDLKDLINIVESAGKNILIPHFHEQHKSQVKADGSIVTQADLACQAFLQEQLCALTPNIGFLGEEMNEKEQVSCLASEKSFWCVDPLDGTSNFATPMPLFAISVALIQQGSPVLACIHDPIRQETFTAIKNSGFYLNHKKISLTFKQTIQQSVGFLDFKRLPRNLAIKFATKPLYRSQRNIGSCALEWAWMAAGRAQFIVHGGEKLWDYAAGSLLAEEAGYHVSDFSGQYIFQSMALSSSILAAPPHIHQTLMQNIGNCNTPVP